MTNAGAIDRDRGLLCFDMTANLKFRPCRIEVWVGTANP
jgi:hypothetical protein